MKLQDPEKDTEFIFFARLSYREGNNERFTLSMVK